MHHSYLSLGSNLQNPMANVNTAISSISTVKGVHLLAQSKLYQTKALLHPDRLTEIQADYINAVIYIATLLSPLELLDVCLSIEANMGRIRTERRWEARIIDIDILLFDNVVLSSNQMTIPHPEMQKRRFVLEPLYEIAPNLILPNGVSVNELLTHLC